MPPVIDSSLGSRYWITDDLAQLDRFFGTDDVSRRQAGEVEEVQDVAGPQAAASDSAKPIESGKLVSSDSALTFLASGTDSAKFKNAFLRAKLIAPLLKTKDRPGGVAAADANLIADGLGVDIGRMTKTVARIFRHYQPEDDRQKGPLTDAELDTARRALTQMLLAKDFASRANTFRPLDRKGVIALVNATLGLLKMSADGELSLDRFNDSVFGEIVDVAKPADMLRLAVKTATTARKEFVGERPLRDTVAFAQALIAERVNAGRMDPDTAVALISRLTQRMNALVEMRLAASKKLDVKFDLGDASKDTVESRLKAVANSMRAFRYDFDRAAGRQMGTMESFRRKLDDVSIWKSNRTDRVDGARYRALLDAETELKGAFDDVCRELGYDPADGTFAFDSVSATSDRACNLTHATNNHIRYYFSGAESKREKFAAEAHAMFDPLIKTGGYKKVTFEAGVDVLAGFKLSERARLEARAGGKYVETAEIHVKPGGKEITVTYYHGGAAEASAEAKFGIDAGDWSDTSKPKISAEARAKGDIGGGRGRTVTYRSLDDFIRDCNGESSLVSVGASSCILCLGKIAQAARAICRKVSDMFTWLGFRIHKSRVDNTAYRALLQQSGVLDRADVYLANGGPHHSAKTSEKSYDVFKGGFALGGGMDVNLFTGVNDKGENESGSIFNLEGDFRYSGELQRRVHGNEMRSRIDTYALESDARLLERYGEIPEDHRLNVAEGPVDELIVELETRMTDLETQALEYGRDDTAEWREVCRKLDRLTLQTVMLERRLAAAVLTADEEDAERLREQLESVRIFRDQRLADPELAVPQAVFDAEMVDLTGEITSSRTVNVVALKVSYDLGSKLAADLTKEQIPFLKADDGDGLGTTVLRQVGGAAVGNVVTTGYSQLGGTGTVEGQVKIEQNLKQDSRPWKNGKTVTVSIKLAPNLPIRELVNLLVENYIDSLTDEPPDDLPTIAKQVGSDILSTLLPGFAVESVLSVYGDLTMGQVLADLKAGKDPNKLQQFLGAPLFKLASGESPLQGLEASMDVDFSKTVAFRFERGRLACLSVAQDMSMEQTLGVRFQAGPVGVGGHIKSAFEQSTVERTVFAHPAFDTMLGMAADYLRAGERAKFASFLTHNKTGVGRLFRSALVALRGNKEKIAAERNAPEIFKRVSESFAKLGELTLDRNASIRDRAKTAFARLNAVIAGLIAMEEDADEAAQIEAMDKLLLVVAETFELDHEAAFLRAQRQVVA